MSKTIKLASLSLTVVVLSVGLLAGCGGKKKASAPPPASSCSTTQCCDTSPQSCCGDDTSYSSRGDEYESRTRTRMKNKGFERSMYK